MSTTSTTRLSSKGQVVIPEAVRKKLGMKAGDVFYVMGEGDIVILKALSKPSLEDFDDVMSKARDQARAAGMKPRDIKRAVDETRSKR